MQEGDEYAAKYGRPNELTIEAFHRAAHIPHVSHLEAVSLEQGVIIMNLLPGKRTDQIEVDEKLLIPNEHISGLIETVMELNKAGIAIDFWESGNILYDKESGFSVLDYAARPEVDIETSVGQVFMLVGALTASRPVDNGLNNDTAYRLERLSKNIELMNRFLDVFAKDCPEFLRAAGKVQQALNSRPKNAGALPPSLLGAKDRGLLYDVHTLPSGEPYDALRRALLVTGLRVQKRLECDCRPLGTLDEGVSMVLKQRMCKCFWRYLFYNSRRGQALSRGRSYA